MIRTKLAIIDYKIDELVSQKKYIDVRLIELYEAREELISQEFGKEEHCGECKND